MNHSELIHIAYIMIYGDGQDVITQRNAFRIAVPL